MRGGRTGGAGKRQPRQAGLGATEPNVILEVYGVNIYGTLRDKLVAQMNALKAEMASGYDPTFSYVYDHHRTAKLQLNSVSVDIDEADVEETIGGAVGSTLTPVIVAASIKVHIAYENGFLDSRDSTLLLNSIDNWLHQHTNLGDDFWIETTGPINPMMLHDESATVGGQVIIKVKVYQEHTQA